MNSLKVKRVRKHLPHPPKYFLTRLVPSCGGGCLPSCRGCREGRPVRKLARGWLCSNHPPASAPCFPPSLPLGADACLHWDYNSPTSSSCRQCPGDRASGTRRVFLPNSHPPPMTELTLALLLRGLDCCKRADWFLKRFM